VVHCAPDPMSPDPDKQTTVAVSYLLTEYVSVWFHDVFGCCCIVCYTGLRCHQPVGFIALSTV